MGANKISNEKKSIARKRRIRLKIRERSDRVRLSIFRSSKHMYAQLIDDSNGSTLASASTVLGEFKKQDPCPSGVEAAKWVGKEIARRAKKCGVEKVVFDKGAFMYHGRVKALAEAAREAGLDS